MKVQFRKLSRAEHIHLACVCILYHTWFAVLLVAFLFLVYLGAPTWGKIIFGLLAMSSFPALLHFLNRNKEEGTTKIVD